jgi:hypothetical protein
VEIWSVLNPSVSTIRAAAKVAAEAEAEATAAVMATAAAAAVVAHTLNKGTDKLMYTPSQEYPCASL